jgi:hypothetical protein
MTLREILSILRNKSSKSADVIEMVETKPDYFVRKGERYE